MIGDPAEGISYLDPAGALEDFAEKAALLNAAERDFFARYQSSAAAAYHTSYQQTIRLMQSPTAHSAFDLKQEAPAVHDKYGDNRFGRACLLARRLVEADVPFVEVTLRGWDEHGGAAKWVNKRSAYVDPAMAALLDDLHERGLWNDTLVIWMGEFGRGPGNGNQHFARAWTTVLAGAGLKTGQVVGRTDETGDEVVERPINAADFMATICKALAIDHAKTYTAAGGRPIGIADKGATPIAELF